MYTRNRRQPIFSRIYICIVLEPLALLNQIIMHLYRTERIVVILFYSLAVFFSSLRCPHFRFIDDDLFSGHHSCVSVGIYLAMYVQIFRFYLLFIHIQKQLKFIVRTIIVCAHACVRREFGARTHDSLFVWGGGGIVFASLNYSHQCIRETKQKI